MNRCSIMMRKNGRMAAGLMLLALVAYGCSVKEDRKGCPCWVDVLFTGAWSSPMNVSFLDTETGRELVYDGVCSAEGGNMILRDGEVPRRVHEIHAFCGADGAGTEQGVVKVSPGKEFCPLCTGRSFVDARSESASAVVEMCRDHAHVTIHVVGAADGYPYAFAVKGTVCGIRVADGSPVGGPFSCFPLLENGLVQVCVPRQKDNSLVLEILEGTTGQMLDVLPLGEYISQTGYDWAARSLVPVDVTLDYARAELEIMVEDWQLGQSFTFVI